MAESKSHSQSNSNSILKSNSHIQNHDNKSQDHQENHSPNQNTSQIPMRLRFAPSPTGYLHVGGARTALYNFLYARQNNGKFILRIEDTDEERSTEESLKMMMEDLMWLGLDWDEGPEPKTLKDRGSFGPYRQSQRLSIYKKVAEELLQKGLAYYCFMSDAEIEAQRQASLDSKKHPQIESPYENMSLEKALEKLKKGESAVVRFKTRQLKKDYVFKDLVRGEITFPSDMVGDFVLLRSGGMPVYNFCCAVDDNYMQISHVLRAEEHLPNTLRQLMIYEAMGWTIPQFGHLSLILDEERKKLSKRRGATSCHEFKMEGYLPEALKNFIALLGWSHPEEKEVLSQEEMIQFFNVDKLHPQGAFFDAIKLKWMNSMHLRAYPDQEIWALIEPFLIQVGLNLPQDPQWQVKSVQVFKTKLETLADAVELYRPLSDSLFQIYPEANETFLWPSTKKVLEVWKSLIEKHDSESKNQFLSEEEFLKFQDLVQVEASVKGKHLFMPLRVAVIGKPHGAELKTLIPLLAKSSLIQRADQCLKRVMP